MKEIQCPICFKPIKPGEEQVISADGAPAHRACYDEIEPRPLPRASEWFTVTKSYKVFNGKKAIGEPMEEFDEDQLQFWLETRGLLAKEEALKLVEEVDRAGSVTVEI